MLSHHSGITKLKRKAYYRNFGICRKGEKFVVICNLMTHRKSLNDIFIFYLYLEHFPVIKYS